MVHDAPGEVRPDVSLHPIGEHGVLLDPAAQKIYRLNASAALVWSCLGRGEGPGTIRDRVQERTGLSAEDAAGHIRIALATWRGLGLLRSRPPSSGSGARPPQPAPPPPRTTKVWVPRSKRGHVVMYRLLDSRVAAWFPSARAVHAAHTAFAHLASGSPARPSSLLNLLRVRNGYRLVADGRVFGTCPQDNEIAPLLKLALTQLALGQCRASSAIHAAGAILNGRAVLLAGPAGSGKTTLAAGLMRDGGDVLADDTVALSRDGASVRAMRLPLCIKRGAWPVLDRLFPELASLPVHRRADGQDVRYLVPRPCGSVSRSRDAARIGAIVFPRYRRDAGLDARRLEPVEAFEALLPQLYPLTNRFDRDLIDRLIRLLGAVACFRLTYGNLPDATAAIREIIAC